MEKCVYCGNKIKDASSIEAKVHTRSFSVCSESCKEKAEAYVKRDSKLKTVLYVILFFVAIGIIGATFANRDGLTARVCQIVAGVSLMVLPYPFVSFEAFAHVSLRAAVVGCRILGAICTIMGIVLLVS